MSLGSRVRVAIETECSAIKAGNVHPYASFSDLNHGQFVAAAKAIGERVDNCHGQPVGQIVLQCVHAMIQTTGTNTSLGTILLMAPLVVAASRIAQVQIEENSLQASVRETLFQLTPDDSRTIYEAIRIAKPGGLGESMSMDLRESAPDNILDAMRLAAGWDDIALQYVSGFELVFAIARRINIKEASGLSKLDSIRCLQVELLSERVDSLIERKQGLVIAKDVQSQASEVIGSGPYGSPEYEVAWHRLDNRLRDKRHRGNPGTIADLIAASLF